MISQIIKESFHNIFNAKLRSFLTLLGILVGTASVVALISSGELATQAALAQFKNLGTDLLAISINQPYSADNQTNARLSPKQIEEITSGNAAILNVAPYIASFANISYQGNHLSGSVIGVNQNFYKILELKMAAGRFISYLDKTENYAVIGNKIATDLQTKGLLTPIGQQIKLNQDYYTIVGVLKPAEENIFVYTDVNTAIFVPILNALNMSKYNQISQIVFKLKKNASIDQTENYLTVRFKILLPKANLFFRSAEQLITSMKNQRRTLTLLLAAIGGISLLVGGIGVMNIMLVSVIERRREIGIRMAIGATPSNIRFMFLIEALVLTVLGGILGILIGIAVSLSVAEFSHWSLHVFLLPPVVGFLVSALTGIFFGYYPASKASKLNPMDCLRSN